MGQYASKFRTENFSSLPRTSPDKADWITAHAVTTKLAIVEVERLWKRFQLMNCNDKGEVTDDVFYQKVISEDIFAKNILTALRSEDGTIKFLTFLNCMKWGETASQDQKIIAVFHLLNNGQPITRDVFYRIIVRMYLGENKQGHDRLTDILMNQLGSTSGAPISQSMFLKRVRDLPKDTIGTIFSFLIVPMEINEEAHRSFTVLSKLTGSGPVPSAIPEESSDSTKQIPSDGILRSITQKIHARDWHMLANKLGFTSLDIKDFEHRNDQSTEEQAFEMLRAWKMREGSLAYAETLENSLQECGLNDAAILLYP